MKLFILGAGKPTFSIQPAALTEVKSTTKALDWHLSSFQPFVGTDNVCFLGGYKINNINESYPSLKTLFIPNWERKKIIESFASIPWPDERAVVCYADTIFTKEIIAELCGRSEDVVDCIDSKWMRRYKNRSKDDIDTAEKLMVNGVECEFTGLVSFSQKAIRKILESKEAAELETIPDLIMHLQSNKSLTKYSLDARGRWAEFNSSNDVANLILGTKADTLARLEPAVSKSRIGHQVSFTHKQWQTDKTKILKKISKTFPASSLAIRSSARTEDGWVQSNAGQYDSILGVSSDDTQGIETAIWRVFTSYGKSARPDDQVLVQKQITQTRVSGVVFTRGLETNSPYYRINFDDQFGNTSSITEGSVEKPRTLLISRGGARYFNSSDNGLNKLMSAVLEIEELLQYDKLDIEFAIDSSDGIHIFQVRPLTGNHQQFSIYTEEINEEISIASQKYNDLQQSSPFVHGDSTVLGVMPDWNPAEILGRYPRPLAFTLYRYLITDEVWAKQRAQFGYCDVRPTALMVSLAGQPYIDVRCSLSSLIPNKLTPRLKNKLANAYIELLRQNPSNHDKIEFEIALTTWFPGFDEIAENRLEKYGFTNVDLKKLKNALVEITQAALSRLESDLRPVSLLTGRRCKIKNSHLNKLSKACALIKDCKKMGTLPFAHAARAGFIGTALLHGLVVKKSLTPDRHQEFLSSIRTVSGDFEADQSLALKGKISPTNLLKKYGHLRPGTYEITSIAYWEQPEKYLFPQKALSRKPNKRFCLRKVEIQRIKKLFDDVNIAISPVDLFSYIEKSIQARENIKFEFTKNISLALDCLLDFGSALGISRELLSFIDFDEFEKLNLGQVSLKQVLANAEDRKHKYIYRKMIELPSLITSEDDFIAFERSFEEPNFITSKNVVAEAVVYCEGLTSDMDNKIVVIENADPGFEWIFSRSIAGLITQYGGANSHMAIRASEKEIPAAIGVGQLFFEGIKNGELLELNCPSRTIKRVKC